jgi:16S rRNA (uracil1498-N3)-methyltransferase
MPTPRFFYSLDNPAQLAANAMVALPDNAAIHASRSLRLQVGDAAVLFNGDGNDYLCELTSIKKNEVIAKVISFNKVERESPLKITLAQGISTGDRMDFTIQKAVEMGVSVIQPIASSRSVVKLTGDRAEKRRAHWQNIVISACEQSGRAFVPEVAAPLTLANWLATLNSAALEAENRPAQLRLTLAPNAAHTLHDLPEPVENICLLIGCEGGLTQEEIDLATRYHFISARLGNRVLRTETAALAALAAMQTLWGDYKI